MASGFTPILGLRKFETLKKKIKAFTLAEVLVTLAIIGVVAALTIPTVVAKYQKKQYYTQFMKVYNTLSNAISLAVAENGNPSGDLDQRAEYFNKYVLPNLKVSKICNQISDCVSDDITTSYLNYTSEHDYYDDELNYNETFYGESFFLNDGTFISTTYGGSRGIYIDFDLNGPSKGPNTWGRDIFSIGYFHENGNDDGKWQLTTIDFFEYDDLSQQELLNKISTSKDMGSYSLPAGCSTDYESRGDSCSTRLLLEGKMDY